MAKCPNCGFNVSDTAYTCIKCGTIITNGSDKEFEIKRTVTVPTPGASRRRRRPGMNLNSGVENKSNIEAIRAMLSTNNEEKPAAESVKEEAPAFAEPVIEKANVIEEPEEPKVMEESVFIEPVIEEPEIIEEVAAFAEPVIEEPVFVEPIIEEAPITEVPAVEINEAPAVKEEAPSLFSSSYARRRHRRLLNSEESASRIEAIKQMMASEEEKKDEVIEAPVFTETEVAPVIEEPEVIEEPVFVEPVIEEAPVIEEPEVVEEPVFVEPIIEEIPAIEEPEVIEEPVFVEPVIEEAPIIEEPEVIEEPVFVEPIIEEIPTIEEPEVIEESVFVEPIIEEIPAIEEPEVVEEPVFVEPVIEEIPVIEEPEVIEEPVFVEPVIEEIPAIEEPEVVEEPVFVEPVIEEAPAIEEPEVVEEPVFVEPVIEEVPVIEEPEIIVEEPVFVEPIIEEIPVIEEPEVIAEEPVFVEPVIEEVPVIEESEVIVEEPVFVEPVIEEIPAIEEPEVIEEPAFVEPIIEEVPVIEEPEVIAEEPVFVEPIIEEIPAIEEPEVIEEPVFVEPVIEEIPAIEEPEIVEEKPVAEEKEEVPATLTSSYSRRHRRMVNAAESASRIEAIKQMMASEEKKEEIAENPVIEEPVVQEPETVIEEPVMEDLYSNKTEEGISASPAEFKDIESDSNGKADVLESLKAEKKNPVTTKNTYPSYNSEAETQRVSVNYGSNYSSGNANSYNSHAGDETFNKIFGEEEKKKTDIKKNPAVLAAVISVAVIAVVVAVIIIISGLGGKRNAANILYQKDNVIYSANLGTGKSEVITENAKIGNSESMIIAEDATYVNADGSLMIYTDKTETDDDGFTLYMKEADANKGTASLIDGDISFYRISEDFSRLVYIKNSEGAFCIRDMEDGGTETVCTGVKLFFTNKSCDRFIYLLENGVLYMKDDRSTPVKLSDNADIDFIDEELNTLYYKENGGLYLYKWQGEKELIANDVFNLRAVTEKGEVYYISETEKVYSFYDFIDDDKKIEDEKLTEAPVEPKEPALLPELDELNGNLSREEYIALIVLYELGALGEEEMAFLEEYYALRMEEYEQSLAEYEKALKEYEKAEKRNALREELKETSFSKTYYVLYYFDGSESKIVTERAAKDADEGEYIDDYLTEYIEKPLIQYADHDEPGGKIKLSTISSTDGLKERIEEFFPSLPNRKIALKGTEKKLDYNPWIFHTYFTEDMEYIYILGNSSYGEAGNLYRIEVMENDLGEMQKIETDLSYERFTLLGNDLIYLKDGCLYINRQKISDVKSVVAAGMSYEGCDYYKDIETLYFINRKDEFVVKNLADGSENIIDTGVCDFKVYENGEFFYVKAEDDGEYGIYTVINKKITRIAEDIDYYEAIEFDKDKNLAENVDGALADFRPVGGLL